MSRILCDRSPDFKGFGMTRVDDQARTLCSDTALAQWTDPARTQRKNPPRFRIMQNRCGGELPDRGFNDAVVFSNQCVQTVRDLRVLVRTPCNAQRLFSQDG
jgi:hypothetical protein